MNLLWEARARLFAPEPLTPDERRDLANRMDVILDRAAELP
jgi:hypothetical protein